MVCKQGLIQAESTQHSKDPIIVKSIENTDYFSIVDGHNRAKLALDSGLNEIDAIISVPEFIQRNQEIYYQRLREDPKFPLNTLKVGENTKEALYAQQQDTAIYGSRPTLNTNRGTILSLTIGVKFDEEIVEYKCLPHLFGMGALVFDIEFAKSLFDKKYINIEKMQMAWGDDTNYDPSVLPSYVEIGNNGEEFRGGGFAHDVLFRNRNSDTHTYPKTTKRPKVVTIAVHVMYPDGSYWSGDIGNEFYKDNQYFTAILWSDKLSLTLVDKYKGNEFVGEHWWKIPTSLIFTRNTVTGDYSFVAACNLHTHPARR